ncbi:hypothetical protein ACFXPI_05730 [Streptomyces sp. NPDC059104]|uniref:hypothetical protein n=1 Tax=Streptomyces sp. NPDC059104 TaxID=3346729 RepID=UPI0036918C5B
MPHTKQIRRSVDPWLHPLPWSIAVLVVIVVVLCFYSSKSTPVLYNTAQLAAQVLSLGVCVIQCCWASERPWRKISN